MKYHFIDPQLIMGVVVALIVFAVGIFAFFVTVNEIPSGPGDRTATMFENRTENVITNFSTQGQSVFNIMGVVLIIGAIMSIVGLVISYTRSGY